MQTFADARKIVEIFFALRQTFKKSQRSISKSGYFNEFLSKIAFYSLKMETPPKTKRKEIVKIAVVLITSYIFYKYVIENWDAIKQFLF